MPRDIAVWLLGLISGVVLFLFRRWLRKDHVTERIDRQTKLVELHRKLKETGLNATEVARLERDLLQGRVSTIRENEDRLIANAELSNSPSDENTSMAEMSIRAHERLRGTNDELDQALRDLENLLEPHQRPLLRESQRKWEEFRKAQSEVVAAHVEGGTIAPLVKSAEMERLAISRIAELREHTVYLRTLFE